MRALYVTILCVVLMGCGVHNQLGGINDARMAVGTTGLAVKAADNVIADTYADAPAEDTDSYCKVKISALILTQASIALKGAADAIRLWEDALVIYLAKKEAGEGTQIDWNEVLSSEGAVMTIVADVAAILEGLRRTLKLWSIAIPKYVDLAWGFVSGFAGEPTVGFEFDWSTLQGSVCIEYLPGGDK